MRTYCSRRRRCTAIAEVSEGRAVLRVGLPLDFSMTAVLQAGGYALLSTQATRVTLAFHDTSDQRLAAAGAELTTDAGGGWHWYRGAPGMVKLRAVEREAPADATATIAGWTRVYRRGRPLEERATARVLRRTHRVRGGDRRVFTVIEERIGTDDAALRRAILVAGDTPAPVPRELFGDACVADASALLTLRPRTTRAWRIQSPPPGAVSAPDLLRRSIARSVAQWLYHDSDLADGGDTETVHQLRVALRRLRSDLQTFAPLLDETWVTAIRGDLRDLAAHFGEVRDAEVLEMRLHTVAAGLDGSDREAADEVVAIIHGDVAAKRAALLAELDGPAYPRLANRAISTLGHPRWASDDALSADVAMLAGRPYRRLRRYIKQLPRAPMPDELHRARILAKRARYAAEACIPAVADDAATAAEHVANLQTVLGEHHDAVVARDWLRACADREPHTAYGCGLIAAVEVRRQREMEDSWRAVWREASRKKDWKWLQA